MDAESEFGIQFVLSSTVTTSLILIWRTDFETGVLPCKSDSAGEKFYFKFSDIFLFLHPSTDPDYITYIQGYSEDCQIKKHRIFRLSIFTAKVISRCNASANSKHQHPPWATPGVLHSTTALGPGFILDDLLRGRVFAYP